MQTLIDRANELPFEQKLICALVAAFVMYKSHYYRFIRKYIVPVFLSVMVYRVLYTSSSSLLEEMTDILSRTISSRAVKVVIGDALGILIFVKIISLADKVLTSDFAGVKKAITDFGFGLVKNTSFVQDMLKKEQGKLEKDFDKELKSKSRSLGDAIVVLPKTGKAAKEVLAQMKHANSTENDVWSAGKLSGAVYNGRPDHTATLNQAFSLYSISNPLHPEIWPSVMKYDSEIIAMTASLVSGGLDTVCGTTSSGGTESIIMAIKAHRDFYRDNHGITEPEMVVGVSAHAAVDKACDMMNIKLIKVGLDLETFRVDLAAMRRAVGPNTIMLYASAPNYPYGTIDDVRGMGRIASDYGIGLHVDCCLGGFILPFARKLGYNVPDFDFSVPGVTSMSLDTHKYGYALKGTSVVLYRTKELRHSQYFCYGDWTGGMYTTPTIAGSRSGGMIAQTWASLMIHGEEGYMQTTGDIYKVVREIAAGLPKIKGVSLVGEPLAMIICFRADDGLNIYSIGDRMSAKGWHMNALQKPACQHLCVTVHMVGKAAGFLRDLEASVEEVRSSPKGTLGGTAAIYGSTVGLPTGPVNELLKTYNDVVLKV